MPKEPRASQSDSSSPCGPMKLTDGDIPITAVDTPDQIWSRVMINCDDNTGVFFFRYQRQMYMRFINT